MNAATPPRLFVPKRHPFGPAHVETLRCCNLNAGVERAAGRRYGRDRGLPGIRNSGSCLLTPVSCTSKMKVQPEMLLKTKDGKKEGIRCQVSGVRKTSGSARGKTTFQAGMCMKTKRRRCQGAHLGSPVQAGGFATVRREKATFQAGMCMKTKRTRCQVSGARCQGAHLGSPVQAGGFATVRREKATFQAGMCMKTKRTRCQVSGARCQGAHLDSPVQADGFATVRREKATFQAGMCMKRGGTGSGVWSLKTSATDRLF